MQSIVVSEALADDVTVMQRMEPEERTRFIYLVQPLLLVATDKVYTKISVKGLELQEGMHPFYLLAICGAAT